MEYTGNDFYCEVALKNTVVLNKEYESEQILAYRHTRPYWPIHVVVVPRKHIPSFTNRSKEDEAIMAEILEVVRAMAHKIEQENGQARILTNLGTYQDSKHLHFHVSSGKPIR